MPEADTRRRPVVQAALLCDYVFEDKRGKSSFMGMFGAIQSTRFPTNPLGFFFVTVFRAETLGDAMLTFSVKSADGSWEFPVAEAPPQTLPDTPWGSTFNFNVRVEALQLPFAGHYWVTVGDERGELARVPLRAELIKP